MKFQWKLFPLQRKLEWDLDAAKGRLALVLRDCEHAASVLQSLQSTHRQQAGLAAQAVLRRPDPQLHDQALAYLAGMEARIAQARAERHRMEQEVAAARVECLRCQQRLDTLDVLRDQQLAQHAALLQQRQARDADCAWLARSGGAQ